MENSWFYLEAGERRGPVAVEELVGALLRSPDPRAVLVWNEEMADWREAGAVPEIDRKLPPPRPVVQMVPPQPAASPIPFDQAENIARYYRRLVLLVGAQLLLGFLQNALVAVPNQGAAVILVIMLILLIVVAVLLVTTAYHLSKNMGESVPILWAIAMFVPCVNIIVLLILSSKAQSWCRRYGIRVGFLGPSKESIEELRQRGAASHFE